MMDPVPLPANPKPMDIKGSPITAATDKVLANTAEQATAVTTLGGKMAGGGGTVEVKNIPPVPSSGNSNIGSVMAGMQELKAIAAEQGKYDGLGNAPAMEVTTGGRRKRSRKNKKNVNKHTRKHRRATHRSARIRHSRRRVHTARRQKTHKK